MAAYIPLLRAVNVGGTGKLPVSDLKALCERAGSFRVRTSVASGNAVCASRMSEAETEAALDSDLEVDAGRLTGLLVRTAAEMAAFLASNPFPDAQVSRTVAIVRDEPPPRDALERATGRADEDVRFANGVCYVHCGDGMARSRFDSRREIWHGPEPQHGPQARRDGRRSGRIGRIG